jgi:hypothetical protein
MGRIVDLITEVAASSDEQGSKLSLPIDAWDRLRDDWGDDEIEDALAIAQASFDQQAVSEAADTVSARVIEILSGFAAEDAFRRATTGDGALRVEDLASLTRCVSYLEEALALVRDAPGPDREKFDQLAERLANVGLEEDAEGPPA